MNDQVLTAAATPLITLLGPSICPPASQDAHVILPLGIRLCCSPQHRLTLADLQIPQQVPGCFYSAVAAATNRETKYIHAYLPGRGERLGKNTIVQFWHRLSWLSDTPQLTGDVFSQLDLCSLICLYVAVWTGLMPK